MSENSLLKLVRTFAGYLNHPATTFTLGAVFIMFVDTYITKGIDSSFISACMDTITAIVAVLALIKAKQIWDEKGKDVGHKYAMQLLTEIVPTMNVSRSTLHHMNLLVSYLNGINKVYDDIYSLQQEIYNKRGFIKEVFSVIDKIKIESIFEINKLNDTCDNLISQVNMCGISIKDNNSGAMLKFQIDAYREFTNKLTDVCLEINLALFFIKPDSKNDKRGGDYVSMDEFMANIELEKLSFAINICERIRELDIELRANINKMIDSKNSFSNYFEI